MTAIPVMAGMPAIPGIPAPGTGSLVFSVHLGLRAACLMSARMHSANMCAKCNELHPRT